MIEINVENWEKFNPRKDVANASWFRFNHSMVFDPAWQHFSAEELMVWVFVLSYASFKSSTRVVLSMKALVSFTRVSEETVRSALEKLEEMASITITSRIRPHAAADVTPTAATRRDVTGRDVTNLAPDGAALVLFDPGKRHEGKRDYEPELRKIYEHYPKRRDNKPTAAFARLKNQITDDEKLRAFASAVRNYTEHCRTENKELRYVMQFMTFCNPVTWVDWVHVEAPANSLVGAVVCE